MMRNLDTGDIRAPQPFSAQPPRCGRVSDTGDPGPIGQHPQHRQINIGLDPQHRVRPGRHDRGQIGMREESTVADHHVTIAEPGPQRSGHGLLPVR
jgi:hypothetical protein